MNFHKDRVFVVAIVCCIDNSLQASRKVESIILAKYSAAPIVICMHFKPCSGISGSSSSGSEV